MKPTNEHFQNGSTDPVVPIHSSSPLSPISAQFPTVSNVPFPHATPYRQQLDLMDTVLQSLKNLDRCDDNDSQDKGNKPTLTALKKTKPKSAAIWFLESPTGTGKSLSLCCSLLTWLQYAEQQEFIDGSLPKTNSSSSTSKKEVNADSTSSTTTGIDWVDNWQSPDELKNEQLSDNVRNRAQQTRCALQQAIQPLQQIQKHSNDNDANDQIKRIHRREHALRMALASIPRSSNKNKRKRPQPQTSVTTPTNDLDFCVADYHSDNDNSDTNLSASGRSYKSVQLAFDDDDDDDGDDYGTTKRPTGENDNYHPESLLSGASLDGSMELYRQKKNVVSSMSIPPTVPAVGNVAPGFGLRKIIYAARTHSQLSQFVQEFAKTTFAKTHRIVALGGRKSLCANPQIHKLSSESAITEACLDLKRNCSYKLSNQHLSTMALHTLAIPTPIEDAATLGRNCDVCGYYATRAALPAAHVVVLPYSLLLSPQSRHAIGLSLQNNVVILDEAHNLPEVIRNLHSATLSLPVLQSAIQQLQLYMQRYGQRLSGRNLVYLNQLAKFCHTICGFLDPTLQKRIKKGPVTSVGATAGGGNNNKSSQDAGMGGDPSQQQRRRRMVTPEDLMIELRLEHFNLYKLLRYMERTRLSQKLLGFRNHVVQQQQRNHDRAASSGKNAVNNNHRNNENSASEKNESNRPVADAGQLGPDGLSKHVSAMSIVQAFMEKLSLSGQEGKIVIDLPPTGGDVHPSNPSPSSSTTTRPEPAALRYVLLRPSVFFDNLLHEAHAVALVGGTLRPFVHVAAELLGHDSSILPLAAAADARMQCLPPDKVSDAFLTSGYTAFACDHVVSPSNVLLQCVSSGPNGVTLDFRHKSRYIHSTCFELGRVIKEVCQIVPNGVVVFLPSYQYEAYLVNHWTKTGLWSELSSIKRLHREPKSSQNSDIALQAYSRDARGGGALLFSVIGGKFSEGINFANEMARCVVAVGLPYPDITDPVLKEKMSNLDVITHNKTISGQDYYHNLTMRAVNQTIGRAIRHANDYAAIILADTRYTTDHRVWNGLPQWVKKGISSQAQVRVPFRCSQQQLKEFFDEKK